MFRLREAESILSRNFYKLIQKIFFSSAAVPLTVLKRLLKRKGSSVIGFESLVTSKVELDESDWMKEVTAHDLVKYGIIPELIGRLPVITALSGLDTEALVKILTVPKNSIVQQYKKLFELDDVELYFEDEALEAIARKAQEQHTGARGLRGIMEDILTDLMFETHF